MTWERLRRAGRGAKRKRSPQNNVYVWRAKVKPWPLGACVHLTPELALVHTKSATCTALPYAKISVEPITVSPAQVNVAACAVTVRALPHACRQSAGFAGGFHVFSLMSQRADSAVTRQPMFFDGSVNWRVAVAGPPRPVFGSVVAPDEPEPDFAHPASANTTQRSTRARAIPAG